MRTHGSGRGGADIRAEHAKREQALVHVDAALTGRPGSRDTRSTTRAIAHPAAPAWLRPAERRCRPGSSKLLPRPRRRGPTSDDVLKIGTGMAGELVTYALERPARGRAITQARVSPAPPPTTRVDSRPGACRAGHRRAAPAQDCVGRAATAARLVRADRFTTRPSNRWLPLALCGKTLEERFGGFVTAEKFWI